MRVSLALLLITGVVFTPVASSSDLFHPVVCDEEIGCIAPEACVNGVHCPADPCDPVADCDARLYAEPTTCAVNATIQGTSCVTSVGGGASAERQLVLPGVGGVGATSVDVGVALMQGEVQKFNLPNTWISPVLETDVTVGGMPLGATSVAVYRSEVIVPGRPRFPDVTGEEHEYSQTTLEIKKYGGQGGNLDFAIGVITLDHLPDGCFVRSSSVLLPSLSCPRPSTLLP